MESNKGILATRDWFYDIHSESGRLNLLLYILVSSAHFTIFVFWLAAGVSERLLVFRICYSVSIACQLSALFLST